jgi:ABC-2 type transport system permease protein
MTAFVPDVTGLGPLYRRRLAVTARTAGGIVGQIATPVLWVLVVLPALDTALGGFSTGVDYFTFAAIGQVAFVVPFTAMFNGINVLVDKEFGITRELVVTPIRRGVITLANGLGVLTVALAQAALIVLLAVLRGAHFHASLPGIAWFGAATALLTLAMYGVAETLALRIGRQDAYGPLIPAVGVTPYLLSGALFPITVLPAGLEQLSFLNPWTHAVAVFRHGMLQGSDSGLAAIWHLHSEIAMAVLSTAALALFAVTTLCLAMREFARATSS